MLKPYDELVKFDISPFVEKRDNLDYLNWAKCVQLLHENGAKTVYFTPLLNEHGSSLFSSEQEFTDKNGVKNRCYECGVHIVIDDLEFDMRGPVMNAANPVKDNSMSQQRIWNCQTRLFVKGVAIRTGLGFNLWVKEEMEQPETSKYDDLEAHDVRKVKERIEQLITQKLDKGMSLEEIAKGTQIGASADDVREMVRNAVKLYNFEGMLRTL